MHDETVFNKPGFGLVKRDVQQNRLMSFQKMAKKRFTPTKKTLGILGISLEFFACAT